MWYIFQQVRCFLRVIAPSKGRDIAKLGCYTVISMDTRNWTSWTSKPLTENKNSANDSVSLNNITSVSFGSRERILKFVYCVCIFVLCLYLCLYFCIVYCIVFVYCVCIFVLCLYFCIVFVFLYCVCICVFVFVFLYCVCVYNLYDQLEQFHCA